MKTIFFVMAAFPLMGMAPIGASVVSVGGSSATTCYHAAAARDASAQALGECNTALTQNVLSQDDMVASYVNRGILRLVRADYSQAEADFSKAMSIDPRQAEAWLNMGIARYQQGQVEGAADMFERAIALKTRYPAIAYFGRGLANEDRGNVKAAYADLRRASALNPGWAAPAEELKRFQVVR